MEEASGSIPLSSTPNRVPAGALGWFLGGLVVGEGSFTSARVLPPFADGTERRRFVFSVEMADDERLIRALNAYFGTGSVALMEPRRAGYKPTARFAISSNRRHLTTTIPFAEAHLLPSAKRAQFERWRDQLLAYLDAHPTRYGQGPSVCSVPECERPVRGRGLCRSHYYRVTGH